MKHIIDIISATPIFEGLPEEQLRDVRKISVQKEYGRGESIFLEGDNGNGFYIVSEGKVKIFKVSMDGKEQILHIFGPGEPFGEVPVFTGKMFPANAQAISKSALLFFPRNDFINLISRNPSLALNMLGVLSMRLRQFTVQVENLSLKEVPGRLAGYLRLLSKEQNNDSQVNLNISKNQLASLLGTIPETMSRIFTKMSERGLIEVEGRLIKLIDNEGLDDLAEQGRL